jgi:hypothetical protein
MYILSFEDLPQAKIYLRISITIAILGGFVNFFVEAVISREYECPLSLQVTFD